MTMPKSGDTIAATGERDGDSFHCCCQFEASLDDGQR
jgi:hypothetical protein